MLQLQKRDKQILRFLEANKAITTSQATDIFFNGLTRSSIRRLNQLEDAGILKHYTRGKRKVYKLTNEKNHISEHDMLILDFYSWIYSKGGEVIEYQKNPRYFNGLLIPDALFKFRIPYNGASYKVCVLLEVDLNHYTSNTKMSTMYEKLCREEVLVDWCEGAEFPVIVLARPTRGIIYTSDNFNCIYTDLRFTNLYYSIFE